MLSITIPTTARNDARLNSLTDAQFRVWLKLLIYSSEQEGRGGINWEDFALVAIEVAKGDEALLTSTVERLVALGLVFPNPTSAASSSDAARFPAIQTPAASFIPSALTPSPEASRDALSVSHARRTIKTEHGG